MYDARRACFRSLIYVCESSFQVVRGNSVVLLEALDRIG